MSEYMFTHKHHTHTHAASGWRIHCGVEVTELSTNKQHPLSFGDDRCFTILVLGAFSTGVFNTNALPHIDIGADVWGESNIMTGVY